MRERRWLAPFIAGLLVVVFGLGIVAGPALSRYLARPAEAIDNVIYDRNTIADIAARVEPSVVSVTAYLNAKASSADDDFFDYFYEEKPNTPQDDQAMSYGTGFIFRPDGYILTNAHVVEGAARVEITLQSDTTIRAKVVGKSSIIDLAVLKIETQKDLPALVLGDSGKMRTGEWVIAIGNPFGYDHSVTAGVLSAKNRNVQVPGEAGQKTHRYEDLLQTDAAINPGNSGGPLLNLDGQVIGINAVVSAIGQGIGFAIPIDVARAAVDQLIAEGRYVRAWMGVRVSDLGDADAATIKKYQLPSSEGIFILQVENGSPADKAGLLKGDVILALDGKTIKSPSELQDLVRAHKVGDQIEVSVLRKGKQLELDLVLVEQPEQ